MRRYLSINCQLKLHYFQGDLRVRFDGRPPYSIRKRTLYLRLSQWGLCLPVRQLDPAVKTFIRSSSAPEQLFSYQIDRPSDTDGLVFASRTV